MKRLAAVLLLAVMVAGCNGSTPSPITTTTHRATTSTASASTTTTTVAQGVPADMLNSAVTQATIRTTICVVGWTATIRPPQSVTEPIKVHQIATYGYSDTSVGSYEEDHQIPLEVGGAPGAVTNLWPEPLAVAKADDGAENAARAAVCAGTLTLAAGQLRVYQLKLSHGFDRAKSLA